MEKKCLDGTHCSEIQGVQLYFSRGSRFHLQGISILIIIQVFDLELNSKTGKYHIVNTRILKKQV